MKFATLEERAEWIMDAYVRPATSLVKSSEEKEWLEILRVQGPEVIVQMQREGALGYIERDMESIKEIKEAEMEWAEEMRIRDESIKEIKETEKEIRGVVGMKETVGAREYPLVNRLIKAGLYGKVGLKPRMQFGPFIKTYEAAYEHVYKDSPTQEHVYKEWEIWKKFSEQKVARMHKELRNEGMEELLKKWFSGALLSMGFRAEQTLKEFALVYAKNSRGMGVNQIKPVIREKYKKWKKFVEYMKGQGFSMSSIEGVCY